MIKVSVVIATYNRTALLQRLLVQLGRQSLPPTEFEVIVVDDGSAEDVAARLSAQSTPYTLTLHRYANAGAAMARHRGIGHARGPVVVIIDDDMQIQPDFLAQHLDMHRAGCRTVVLGWIRPDPDVPLPLFERFHAESLERFAEGARTGRFELQGTHLATGNVSFLRDDYDLVGGFDPALKHSEDAELGVRLQKSGVTLRFSERAYVLHSSDHLSVAVWMRRAFLYGVCDLQIARKHSDLPSVDPWRYLWIVNPVSRPLLLASVIAPTAMHAVARIAMSMAFAVDRLRARRVAIFATTLVYGIEYFRGIRHGAGSIRQAMADFRRQRRLRSAMGSRRPWPVRPDQPRRGAWSEMVAAIRADHQTVRRYSEKYGQSDRTSASMVIDGVRKIGFQMMVGYRFMRFLAAARIPLAPLVMSRLMRHAYGADIHWNAQFEPGVAIVHGMGLCISRGSRVASGVILFQGVTLGEGTGPDTRRVGSPSLETDVHVGPGATLIGPITIGRGSKIMAGYVVTRSIPPSSIVEAPAPVVRSRVATLVRAVSS